MNKKIIGLSILILLITSCFNNNVNPNSSSQIDSQSDTITSSSSEYSSDTSSEEIVSSSESSSEEIISSSESTSESSSSSSSSEDIDEPYKTIEIYASNDIHGVVLADNSYSAGLGEFGTYFKQKGEEPNTLLIDQGDTWQGSIYSNYNHGQLITDVMNYAKFDARTVGNHDFDWGVEYLRNNTARKYNDYATPVLAGNVYDYDMSTHTMGNNQQSDLGVKSVTYTLENGLKVGILGGIGYRQITSINSLYTKNIGFADHINFIKEEATHLRDDENCDVVICSIHTGQEDVLNNDLKDYVDLVLCGHTHKKEYTKEDNLYYVQNSAYMGSFSHITLTYDVENELVSNTDVSYISNEELKSSVAQVDYTIYQLINSYSLECLEAADEVLANSVTGYFGSSESANLMAKAIYDEAVLEKYDIDFSYTNSRKSLGYGSYTYADLYNSFPFDNEVYIISITGEEIENEIMCYNNFYHNPSKSTTIKRSQTYKIACIDYLAFHTNENRYYDYFPSIANADIDKLPTLNNNYRVILKEWLKNNQYSNGTNLDVANYRSSVANFNKNNFSFTD